jgi:hypothetical protein
VRDEEVDEEELDEASDTSSFFRFRFWVDEHADEEELDDECSPGLCLMEFCSFRSLCSQ